MSRATVQRQKKKTRIWTTPAVLSILIGLVGALGVIELRPQLVVSPQAELVTNQPFSCPFEITNTGYLGFHVDRVAAIIKSVELPIGVITDGVWQPQDWKNFELDRGGSKTILVTLANMPPKKADIVIGLDYTYFGVRGRRFFRFQGIHMERWAWSKQPVGDESGLNILMDKPQPEQAN